MKAVEINTKLCVVLNFVDLKGHTCTRSFVKIFNTTYHTWAKVTVDQKKRRQAKKFCDFRKKRIRFRLANTTCFSIFCRILLHVFRKRKLVHVCSEMRAIDSPHKIL